MIDTGNKFRGLPVVVDNSVIDPARLQVSKEFERLQSPRLVLDTNKWMREFFGTTPMVQILKIPAPSLFDPFAVKEVLLVSPAGLDALRAREAQRFTDVRSN